MINLLRRFFASPIFADEERNRTARFLNIFLWCAICVLVIATIVRVVTWTGKGYTSLWIYPGLVVLMAVGLIMIHWGYVHSASTFLIVTSWMALTLQIWVVNGFRDSSVVGYIVVIVLSSILLGWRVAALTGAASLAVIWFFAVLEKSRLRPLQVDDPLYYARDLSVMIILIGILLYLLISNWSRTLQSARIELQERLRADEKLQRQADYLTSMNRLAMGSLNRLELRSLLRSVLDNVCTLLDTKLGAIDLILPDGSALRQEVGYDVLARHNGMLILKGQGLSGSVWAGGETILVQDYAVWEKGLPGFIEDGFKATMGVPLKVENTIIGVLAVSYVEKERTFSQEQVSLTERFASLASLVIDNVRLYEQAQKELAERRNTETALQKNEERTRAILNSMPDMIFEISNDGTFLDFMASAELKPALPPEHFIGKNIKDIFPSAITQQTMFALERALATDQLHAFEYGLPPGEETQFFEARISAITPKSAIIIVRDISQRKWVETEREKLINELEDKNSELERFTYTVSHDLKSPIITIKGFLGFLEQDAASGNIVRLKADIQRIASATDKMQMLLNELLELTRIGRLKNPSQNVDFGELVREAIELVHGRIQSRGIQISIQENLPTIYVDRHRLVEVLQNLIDNAAKFMGDQSAPRIEIGLSGYEGDLPIFHVRDNGIGIEVIHRDRIFGLFNKLDAESEGTGIGLALVKRIIEVHGGRIWVESEPGKGAAFLFTLPVEPAS